MMRMTMKFQKRKRAREREGESCEYPYCSYNIRDNMQISSRVLLHLLSPHLLSLKHILNPNSVLVLHTMKV